MGSFPWYGPPKTVEKEAGFINNTSYSKRRKC